VIDYLEHLRRDSLRFGELVRAGSADAAVPSCPEWRVSDLGFHLAEVQYFWASIVEGPLLDPGDVEELQRPVDAEISGLFDAQSLRLVRALTSATPEDQCWTWHPDGTTVSWVLRRQAHEALIHRVDAELAVVGASTAVDRSLAVDGVDEVLAVMVGGYPSWADFEHDGTSIAIRLTDDPASWQLSTGRMKGTSPNTGIAYDLEGFTVTPGAKDADATITASAAGMDLWLWGRGNDIAVVGDHTQADRIRRIAAEDTQ